MQRRLVEQISLVAGSLPVFLPVPEAAGHGTLDAGWKGDALPMGAFFWNIFATSVNLGCGGSGGMVTPIFFIGTAAGNLFAQLFNPHYRYLNKSGRPDKE